MADAGKFVIGIDPGTHNMALTYFYVNATGNVSIKKSMLFPQECIISNLTDKEKVKKKKKKKKSSELDFSTLVENYSKLLDKLLKQNVDVIGIERWMVRGRFGGAQSECVSLMIGILVEKCRKKKIPVHLLNAAVWKNKVNKDDSNLLQKLYNYTKKNFNLPPHYVDSFLQGCYAANVDYSKVCRKSMLRLLAFVAGYTDK